MIAKKYTAIYPAKLSKRVITQLPEVTPLPHSNVAFSYHENLNRQFENNNKKHYIGKIKF